MAATRAMRAWGKLRTNYAWQRTLVKAGRMLEWTQPNSFLVLTTARAGTTLFVDYLNCHPRIRCHFEILGQDHGFYGEPSNMGRERLKLHFESFFVKRPSKLKGAKILNYHLDDLPIKLTDLIEILDRPKILVLYRQQVLEQYISLAMAVRDGQGHVKKPTKSMPICIDPGAFVAYREREVRMWRENLAILGDCGASSYYLTYEQLTSSNQTTMAGVFQFLGLNPCAVRSRYVKQHPESLSNKLANYDEFVRHGIQPDELLHLPFSDSHSASAAA